MSTGKENATVWSSTQAYSMAVICLLLGLAVGYLLRGSSTREPAAAPANAPTAPVPSGQLPGSGGMPTGAQSADMVDKVAAPMLAALKDNPKDTATLAKLGNLYYDAQLYPQAIDYYERALQIAPANADIRTDMGTAYFYQGDSDRALAEFAKSLSYRPNHPQTLFNMGIVKLQGKSDPRGAIAAWEKLLATNPDYPEKQKVVDMIARAKEQAGR